MPNVNCPNCGNEISDAAHKCRYCGEWIDKQCPNCGEWIRVNAKKCRYCKTWLDEDETLEDDAGYELQDKYNVHTHGSFITKTWSVIKYIFNRIIQIFIAICIWYCITHCHRSTKSHTSESEYIVNDEEDASYMVEDTCYMDEYVVAEEF